MHDIPDTEDQDADAEKYWPANFKQIIRTRLKDSFTIKVTESSAFTAIHNNYYKEYFDSYEEFVSRLGEIVLIGAENGADEIFDEIYNSFFRETDLPDVRTCANYFWPQPLSDEIKKELHQAVFEEYRGFHDYVHIFEDHINSKYQSFDEFINRIAALVVTGAVNGADDSIGKIYHSFLTGTALPILRRYPRRVK